MMDYVEKRELLEKNSALILMKIPKINQILESKIDARLFSLLTRKQNNF